MKKRENAILTRINILCTWDSLRRIRKNGCSDVKDPAIFNSQGLSTTVASSHFEKD